MTDSKLPIEVSCRDVERLRDAGEDFFFFDCREPEEFEFAKIEGAVLIPMNQLVSRAEELSPHRERRVVVLCHAGMRSLRVAAWLREQGYAQAQSMAGGIDAWSCDIDPTVPRY
jgi:rhodanese-related sulfurtransferase